MDVNLITLDSARQYEEIRIAGYKTFLSFPDDVLDAEGRVEINEALDWSNHRLELISGAIAAIDMLLTDGYPDRVQQVAAGRVIKQLNDSLLALRLASDEFDEGPKGTIEVSEEIPV